MRLGQTSLIHFLSNLLASALGFLATLYIARLIGSEPLGIYNLVLGLVSWLAIAGKVGISGAISKRVSEGEDQGQYALAGVSIIGILGVVISLGLFLFRNQIGAYVEYPAAGYAILILIVVLMYGYINSLLIGLHLVHVSGLLSPLKIGGRAGFQMLLITIGLSTTGLFLGHIAGFVFVILIGLYYVIRNIPELSRPRRHHYESIADYAKFSWLGNLQSRMFNYTDIIILGFFVSSGLIGIYAVAWNISQFLILFSGALKSTLFPEVSEISNREDTQAVASIVEDSLSFGGLFLIPGLFGGAVLGERILRMYGPEFTQGATVLTILIIANLFMGYQNQLLSILNGIDRPDLSFRVNALFVGANITFNIVLIYFYGWVGAAIATAFSVAISLLAAYYILDKIINFAIPVTEIGFQWVSALIMTIVVVGALRVENTYHILGHNAAVVIFTVGLGAAVYFLSLLVLSQNFRETVNRNIPVDLPLLS
jgi:O-antigen/teichoic acid export membrane protein